ncbi:MAG: hypothetical protein M1834_002930 [Cirrosporium novae-zelandiae]|nr:MAG: hypothetical protein M1834_002930 [Cirrosporium novae-zelandiae]
MDSDPSAPFSYNNAHFPFKSQSFRSSYPRSPTLSSFKLDEGYSEETRSQTEGDVAMEPGPSPDVSQDHPGLSSSSLYGLAPWVLNLSKEQREDFAFRILQSLPTTLKAEVLDKLTPLTHFDPVYKLPPEITHIIFSYLDPVSLVKASTASREWRGRTLENSLWKQLYKREGWGSNGEEVRNYEEEKTKEAGEQTLPKAGNSNRRDSRKSKSRQTGDDINEPKQKKRHVETTQHSEGQADHLHNDTREVMDEIMPDVAPRDTLLDRNSNAGTARDRVVIGPDQTGGDDSMALVKVPPSEDLVAQMRKGFSLLLPPPSDLQKVNWRFLYNTRLQLENNWENGRFTRFELPHPEHLHERHRDCVYTIQYSSKYLVSGSRDRTLRIWDIETGRMVRSPLTGHEASVLCLQFDDTPNNDIIISGGSDFAVIVWRFSTGEIIKHIKPAHHESVLNLRFDDRYLVTCSKDRTIKVWNRREITTLSDEYPRVGSASGSARVPSYIINIDSFSRLDLEARLASGQDKPLAPFTCLLKLQGHGAAVNAVQIYDNKVVSASGDRTLKVWDIRTGLCLKTIPGHVKGIACVQFDGRRIVSGSSDNTIRIFDSDTGAEVACLRGHTNLVRTIQAGFGDVPGSESELRTEAMAAEQRYIEGVRSGRIPPEGADAELSRRARRARKAALTHADDITAYRAMLPPGGGGSQWGRIVSGSYDEMVLIWKKDRDGKWVISQKLRHDDALRASGNVRARRDQAAALVQMRNAVAAHQAAHQAAQAQAQGANGQLNLNLAQAAQNAAHLLGQQNLPLLQNAGHPIVPPAPQSQNQQQQIEQVVDQAQVAQGQQPTLSAQAQHDLSQQQQLLMQAFQAAQQQQQPQHPHHHQHVVGPPLIGPAQGLHGPAIPYGSQPTSRVFKLQFDSRRIICCSQHWKIVGWDFANGDKDIMESSRFFNGP